MTVSSAVPGQQEIFDGVDEPRADGLRAAAAGPLAQQLPRAYLEQFGILPLQLTDDGSVLVAVAGPVDVTVLDELALTFDRSVQTVAVPASDLHRALLSAHADTTEQVEISEVREPDASAAGPDDQALDDIRVLASQAPIIKLVNLTILEALRRRASDVHLESRDDGLRVRYRVDGVLHDAALHARQHQAAIVSRVKVMANLNIAERRIPQDGRVRLRLSDRELDLRVSTLPTVHGESVVLRVLDRAVGVRDLGDLGMDDETAASFERLVTRPHGIVLVTGPTGSGKTTTLYAALQRINRPDVKIVTVEDPVEYQLDGLTQIPINPKAGRTFAAIMRSVLRHDPDVIMVGEMRDRETADTAIQAALTGHLVFSTLHTNDAPSGITRLIDMGIEPYLVAATVRGLLAQRLVRSVCEDCAVRYAATAEERRNATAARRSIGSRKLRRGAGCAACGETGYRGRVGVYELLVMTEPVRELVVQGASLDDLRARTRADGTVSLHQAAWAAARAGVTTTDEVYRVSRDDLG